MLVRLSLAVLALATASPDAGASPDAAPVDLREIGHVRAVTPFCRAVVEGSSNAVSDAFEGDARIALLISSLTKIDLDTSEMKKQAGLVEMRQRHDDLQRVTAAGDKQIKDLRAKINTSTDPAERAQLLAFANALGGAIFRQRVIFKDYQRILATAEDMPRSPNPMYMPSMDRSDQRQQNTMTSPGGLSTYVRGQVLELETKLPAVSADEAHAGELATPAFSRCASALPESPSPGPVPTL
jgi:hypothetical protein